MKTIIERTRTLGPYLAVPLLVPGGVVIAPLMWLAQQQRRKAG